MPEAGYLPIPSKLARAGVKDLVRISDARMSGTAYGAIILHVAPDAPSGGPIGLVRSGDRIRLSVARRTIELLVDETELKRREATNVLAKAPQSEATRASTTNRSFRPTRVVIFVFCAGRFLSVTSSVEWRPRPRRPLKPHRHSTRFGRSSVRRHSSVALDSLDRSGIVSEDAPELAYPFHDRDVLVTACGRICMHRKRVNVSPSLPASAWESKKSTKAFGSSASCVTILLHRSGAKDLATPRQPVRPGVVTHVLGTVRYLCARVRPDFLVELRGFEPMAHRGRRDRQSREVHGRAEFRLPPSKSRAEQGRRVFFGHRDNAITNHVLPAGEPGRMT